MMEAQVKTIGSSGQISLGKEYAGRPVLIEEIEQGVWLIKTARIIPDSEMWMHEEPAKSRIEKAIKWAEKQKAKESDLGALSEKIG
ncbi:MAG: hypothetical protein AABY54_01185 [Deltaproteobacteria bacterium]